jgi:hypothetical protein
MSWRQLSNGFFSLKALFARDFQSSPPIGPTAETAARSLHRSGRITIVARESICAEWNDTARPLALGSGAAKHPRTQVVRMGVPWQD